MLVGASNQDRIRRITNVASGFVYYVSLKGVTGAGHLAIDEVRDKLDTIRAETDLPVGVGFGIKDARTAGEMAEFADAVVVGSALVGIVEKHGNEPEHMAREIGDLIGGMRQAMDA